MPKLVIAPVVGISDNELPAWAYVERAVFEHALEGWPEPRRGISSDTSERHPLWLIRLAHAREYVPVAHFQYAKNEVNASDFGLPAHQNALRPSASNSPLICMGSNGRITPKAWDYSAEPPSH